METKNLQKKITVHPQSDYPTTVWKSLEEKQKYDRLVPLPLDTEVQPNAVRFVCISDTHSRTSRMQHPIPMGDVFIHAGDFTMCGDESEVKSFNCFLETLPHKYKIVIAGNHELGFEKHSDIVTPLGSKSRNSITDDKDQKHPSALLTACHYLQDSAIDVYGIKIYGTPWQPRYGNWEFNIKRGEACLEKWNLIPNDVDVLVTHSPPLGHGDFTKTYERAGCVELLSTVQNRVKPKYHIFGHIHEGYGITTDGQTTFMNVSTCNVSYRPVNPPVIFDFPLPEGQVKS